jgi:hypothetical protein
MRGVGGSVVILEIDAAGEKTGPHSKPTGQRQNFLPVRAVFAIYEIPEETTGWSRYQVDKATVRVSRKEELISAHGDI